VATHRIFNQAVPRTVLMQIDNPQDFLVRLLGPGQYHRIEKYGLTVTTQCSDIDTITDSFHLVIDISGNSYWLSVWLLDHNPRNFYTMN
jgi:hypothetical protein